MFRHALLASIGLLFLVSCLILFFIFRFVQAYYVGFPFPQDGGSSYDDVLIHLWVSHHSVKVGQPLQIRLTAQNKGNQTAVYQTQTRPVLQLGIAGTRMAENEVVRGPDWPDGKTLTPELTRLELKPGETKTILEMTWTPDERFAMSMVTVGGMFYPGIEDDLYAPPFVGATVYVGWAGPGPLP